MVQLMDLLANLAPSLPVLTSSSLSLWLSQTGPAGSALVMLQGFKDTICTEDRKNCLTETLLLFITVVCWPQRVFEGAPEMQAEPCPGLFNFAGLFSVNLT